MSESYETRLAKRITASIRTYEQLSRDCWAAYDIPGAARWRNVADGLEIAQQHQLAVAAEMRAESGQVMA